MSPLDEARASSRNWPRRLTALGRHLGSSSLSTQYPRSEEHTSELQSRPHLVCRLLLEKKKKTKDIIILSHQIILDNMHICTMFNETITLDTSQLHQLNHLLLTSLLFNLIKSNISQDIK